jgi:hypothetical protein
MTTCDRCGKTVGTNDWDIHTCTQKVRSTIDMARESHLDVYGLGKSHAKFVEALEHFAALVRADERNRTWTQEHWTEYERSIAAVEREACAKVCEELVPDMSRTANDASVWDVATFDCATAIRARGNT